MSCYKEILSPNIQSYHPWLLASVRMACLKINSPPEEINRVWPIQTKKLTRQFWLATIKQMTHLSASNLLSSLIADQVTHAFNPIWPQLNCRIKLSRRNSSLIRLQKRFLIQMSGWSGPKSHWNLYPIQTQMLTKVHPGLVSSLPRLKSRGPSYWDLRKKSRRDDASCHSTCLSWTLSQAFRTSWARKKMR